MLCFMLGFFFFAEPRITGLRYFSQAPSFSDAKSLKAIYILCVSSSSIHLCFRALYRFAEVISFSAPITLDVMFFKSMKTYSLLRLKISYSYDFHTFIQLSIAPSQSNSQHAERQQLALRQCLLIVLV